MAIDVHSHYFPRKVFEELGGRFVELRTELREVGGEVSLKIGTVSWQGVLDPGFVDEDKIASDTQRQSVDLRVLSFTPLSFFYDIGEETAGELYRRYNDAASKLAEKHKGRIFCMASVPLQNPSLAIEELKRVRNELGLVGVEIGSNVKGLNLDDPSLRPFFREAARLDLPVFIHPASVAAAERLRRYYLINFIGNPLDTTIAAASLIFGGVLDELPNLRIILAHAGGFLPFQIGRFDHGFRVRDEPKVNRVNLPSQYLKNFYFDTITHNRIALEFLVKQVGSGHVLLGSDYPFDMGSKDPSKIVKEAPLTETEKEDVLSRNAERLFSINL